MPGRALVSARLSASVNPRLPARVGLGLGLGSGLGLGLGLGSGSGLGLELGLGLGLERHRLVQEAQVRPRVARPAATKQGAMHVRDERADVSRGEFGA